MMKENKQICRPCTIYIYAQKLGTCRQQATKSFFIYSSAQNVIIFDSFGANNNMVIHSSLHNDLNQFTIHIFLSKKMLKQKCRLLLFSRVLDVLNNEHV